MDHDIPFSDPFGAFQDNNSNFLPLLDSQPLAPDEPIIQSRKRPIFDLFSDFDDLEEPPTAPSDVFSWPSLEEHGEEEDVTTELLSIPSFDNGVLSRTTSLDSCFLSPSSQTFNSTQQLGRANSNPSKPFRIPDSAKALLDAWFSVHINDPYLKSGDATALAHLTDLSEQQVKTYIANRRSRKLGATGITSAASIRQDSIASLQSAPSSASVGRRRGRRRFRTSSESLASPSQPPNPARIYHCTFSGCNSDFARKSDWKRHEQTAHCPQEEWICLLSPPVIQTTTGELICGFCELETASDEHLELAHRYSDCSNKAEAERTFGRKDKLAQHLSQVHGVEKVTSAMSTNWMRPVNRDIAFVCGFCSESCEDWNKRADHIAAHFETGLDMNHWLDP